ncbi:hypothetical protein [Oceaniradius stylonematis]|uniref:hypothetical protein n=1 Tax=Oceaniradius stylonematis TaxID=2184161 RepID=UPI001313F2CC|nr:hypothetical protein [Oceaniradius stylonematis]
MKPLGQHFARIAEPDLGKAGLMHVEMRDFRRERPGNVVGGDRIRPERVTASVREGVGDGHRVARAGDTVAGRVRPQHRKGGAQARRVAAVDDTRGNAEPIHQHLQRRDGPAGSGDWRRHGRCRVVELASADHPAVEFVAGRRHRAGRRGKAGQKQRGDRQ